MKGSTLHRSGLTREKMGVLANISQVDTKKHSTEIQLNQYYKATKAQELDLLWGSVQKGIQKVQSVTKTSKQKSPAVYFTIGFIAGVLFMCLITLIVSIFSMNPRPKTIIEPTSNVAVIGSDSVIEDINDTVVTKEKYIVKKGDTLNGIAYRFYGKHPKA